MCFFCVCVCLVSFCNERFIGSVNMESYCSSDSLLCVHRWDCHWFPIEMFMVRVYQITVCVCDFWCAFVVSPVCVVEGKKKMWISFKWGFLFFLFLGFSMENDRRKCYGIWYHISFTS